MGPYGFSDLWLINYVPTSSYSKMVTVPAGTLWNGKGYDSTSLISSTELEHVSTLTVAASRGSMCPPTQACSPFQPVFRYLNPSQRALLLLLLLIVYHRTLVQQRLPSFDFNENWMGDREHYDTQKVNGLTFPRVIKSSAFTQKLDIEGYDPVALPVAALL